MSTLLIIIAAIFALAIVALAPLTAWLGQYFDRSDDGPEEGGGP